MSYNGKLTPLNVNAMSSLLQDNGLNINPASASFMGTSTGVSNYTPGTVASTTVLAKIASCIRLAYQLNVAGTISADVYNNMISLGSASIPALGNSKPSTYTRTYTGQITSYGFVRQFPLQAYNEFHINNGSYSDFLSTFTNAVNLAQSHNEAITAMTIAPNYLAGTYSNMNDLITSDITGVSLATLYWGQDLIATGKAIDLSSIDTFGNPDNLLRTINNNKAASQAFNLALIATGMTSADLTPIFNGQSASIEQQRLIYAAFCMVMNDDLQEILIPLNVQTKELTSLADLLDPKKLFPNSYQTLTYPEYNITPLPTNSKTYHLIYTGDSVNTKQGFSNGSRLRSMLPADLAYACDSFSTAMMQIKNIKSMDIQKFSQVVTNMESVTDLAVNGTSIPADALSVNAALPLLAKGSNSDGTYNMCDFFGCMTDLHYDWNTLKTLVGTLQSTTLVNIYNDIYTLLNGAGPYTGLQNLINNANTEIAYIKSQQPALASSLNTLYDTFGKQLTKEQNARDLAFGDLTLLVSKTTDVISFISNIGSLSAQTETKGPARVLESIANTDTLGGKSLAASMREARNAMKLGLTGAVQDNAISDNALVLAPITGSMTSLGVPVVTGAAVVPGSLAGSPETTLVPPNLSIFETPSNTKAVLTPAAAIDSVTTCNCDCWDV